MGKAPDWRSKVDPARLADLEPFAGIDQAGLAEIAARAQPRRIAKNETLFEQGAPATGYFVLLDGRLKIVQVTEDGQQIVVRFVGPGEPAGALAALGIASYPASAIAVTDSLALAWNAAEAARLMTRFPSWAMSTSRAVGGGSRKRMPGSARSRPSGWSGASRMRFCASPVRPEPRSRRAASASSFRSAGRT